MTQWGMFAPPRATRYRDDWNHHFSITRQRRRLGSRVTKSVASTRAAAGAARPLRMPPESVGYLTLTSDRRHLEPASRGTFTAARGDEACSSPNNRGYRQRPRLHTHPGPRASQAPGTHTCSPGGGNTQRPGTQAHPAGSKT